MSVVDEGRAELDRQHEAARARDAYHVEENRKHTLAWWIRDFYDSRRMLNPEWTYPYCGVPRKIENPATPLPVVGNWQAEGTEMYDPSSWTAEGIRWECEWKFEGTGGDRADWDNGWWPDFYVLRTRLLRRPKRIKVGSPAGVAEALS